MILQFWFLWFCSSVFLEFTVPIWRFYYSGYSDFMILILPFKYSNSQFGLVVYDSNFAILQFWFWSSGFFYFTVPFDSFRILVISILQFWFYDSNYSNSWFQFYGFTIQISRFCGSAFSISRFNFFKFMVLIWWFMILITWFYNFGFHDLFFSNFSSSQF